MSKPKLPAEQLVTKMRDEKGITFKHMSEEDALIFLKEKTIIIDWQHTERIMINDLMVRTEELILA